MNMNGLGIALGAAADAWRDQERVINERERHRNAQELFSQQQAEYQRQMGIRSQVDAVEKEYAPVLQAYANKDWATVGQHMYARARGAGYGVSMASGVDGVPVAHVLDPQGNVVNQYRMDERGADRAIRDSYQRDLAIARGDLGSYFGYQDKQEQQTYARGKDDREFDLRERGLDASIAANSDASSRGWAGLDLQRESLNRGRFSPESVSRLKELYAIRRDALLNGDIETAQMANLEIQSEVELGALETSGVAGLSGRGNTRGRRGDGAREGADGFPKRFDTAAKQLSDYFARGKERGDDALGALHKSLGSDGENAVLRYMIATNATPDEAVKALRRPVPPVAANETQRGTIGTRLADRHESNRQAQEAMSNSGAWGLGAARRPNENHEALPTYTGTEDERDAQALAYYQRAFEQRQAEQAAIEAEAAAARETLGAAGPPRPDQQTARARVAAQNYDQEAALAKVEALRRAQENIQRLSKGVVTEGEARRAREAEAIEAAKPEYRKRLDALLSENSGGQRGLSGRGGSAAFADHAAFVEEVLPAAVEAANALGVQPGFIIAQAALESGWGNRQIKRADGSPSYNIFGVKADKSWRGDVAEATTTEHENGRDVKQKAKFRAYGSYEEAVRDYVEFLRNNPRYADVLGAQSVEEFASRLQKAGYATDPNYRRKIPAGYEEITAILQRMGLG